jgi:hypothetical protein
MQSLEPRALAKDCYDRGQLEPGSTWAAWLGPLQRTAVVNGAVPSE